MRFVIIFNCILNINNWIKWTINLEGMLTRCLSIMILTIQEPLTENKLLYSSMKFTEE